LNECQKMPQSFPSNFNTKCQQFKKANPNFDWKSHSSIKIWYNRHRHKTYCYTNHTVEDYGWCGVCNPSAEPGKPGHCDQFMEGNQAYARDESERTMVKPGENWGYCTPECDEILNGVTQKSTKLQETELSILTNEQCSILVNGWIKGGTELCAGFKHEFPKYQVFERKYAGRDYATGRSRYQFVPEGKGELQKLGVSEAHQKLNFYLGYSDSCSGDSGGPLFMFVDKKLYQYGVVSHGEECGGWNQPGIYVSLAHKPNLDWVLENSKDGSC